MFGCLAHNRVCASTSCREGSIFTKINIISLGSQWRESWTVSHTLLTYYAHTSLHVHPTKDGDSRLTESWLALHMVEHFPLGLFTKSNTPQNYLPYGTLEIPVCTYSIFHTLCFLFIPAQGKAEHASVWATILPHHLQVTSRVICVLLATTTSIYKHVSNPHHIMELHYSVKLSCRYGAKYY